MLLKLRAIIARPTRWSTLLSQKYRLSMYGMRYGPNMKRLQQTRMTAKGGGVGGFGHMQCRLHKDVTCCIWSMLHA